MLLVPMKSTVAVLGLYFTRSDPNRYPNPNIQLGEVHVGG